MEPSISIICQPDGIQVATQLAKLLTDQDLPVVGNFPSTSGSLESHSPRTLVNEQTALVVLVVSQGWFGHARASTGGTVDPEAMQRLFSLSTGAQNARIFPLLIDDGIKESITNTWLNEIQWYVDNTTTRNILLQKAEKLEAVGYFDNQLSAFDGVHSVIEAIEAASDVELVARERASDKNVAYDVYVCRHKIRETLTTYIHLYRGVTLTQTAAHLRDNPIPNADDAVFLLSKEAGQKNFDDRIENIKKAFKAKSVMYLENIVAHQIRTANDEAIWEGYSNHSSYFLEPQLRRNLSFNKADKGSDFKWLVGWLESSSAGVTVIEGQGGIGKTWTMKELLGRIKSGNIRLANDIERSTIFIASTDVNRPGSTLNDVSGSFTLYDLYVAAVTGRQAQDKSISPIEEEIFYNALKMGSIVVFVDGLDEVIARHRGTFDPDNFFGDLQLRMQGGSNAKVILSCRKLFFDQYEYALKFPSVQTYEILAFDEALRDTYFEDELGQLKNKMDRAKRLSENLAVLPETRRYVPFVLSLIVDIMLEEADDPGANETEQFQNFFSDRLLQSDYSDRVIGQFCEREIKKVGDRFRSLTVDQQVEVFCGIAYINEGDSGRADTRAVRKLIRQATGLKSVGDLSDTFLSHPFLIVSQIGPEAVVDLRFDFMTEHFLMLDLANKLKDVEETDENYGILDIQIFNKYCNANSTMCQGLALRLGDDIDAFGLCIIGLQFTGERLIAQDLEDQESNILTPSSAASQFSYSLISLIVAQLSLKNNLSTSSLTKALTDIFSSDGKTISRMAIMDGVHTGDTRFRLDFRGLTFVECLFHSIDIWSCQFDQDSKFIRCRFIACDGVRSKDDGITGDTFDATCMLDDVFEKAFEIGETKITDTQEKIKSDITAFVSDFYSSGRYDVYTEDYIERHYNESNPAIKAKKMIQVFRRHGVLVSSDRKNRSKGEWFMMSEEAKPSIERLITQGVLSGVLKRIATEFL